MDKKEKTLEARIGFIETSFNNRIYQLERVISGGKNGGESIPFKLDFVASRLLDIDSRVDYVERRIYKKVAPFIQNADELLKVVKSLQEKVMEMELKLSKKKRKR